MQTKIAITGGTGKIGRRLLIELEALSIDVTATCRSRPPGTPCAIRWIECDLAKQAPPEEFLSGANVLIHLAGVIPRTDQDGDNLEDNIRMASNLAIAIDKASLEKIVLVSSLAATTFEQERRNAREYGRTKFVAEQELVKVAAVGTARYVTLRPPAIYGQDISGPVQTLGTLVKTGIPLPLGSATALRSYLSLPNFIDLLITLATAEDEVWQHIDGHVIEPSDGLPVSTRQLCIFMAEQAGRKVKLMPFPVKMLKLAGMVTGKSQLVSGAFDEQQTQAIAQVSELTGWHPIEQMPESLAYLRA